MAARASLKKCVLAALENFQFHQYPQLAIVRHSRGKYYSLLPPAEFARLPGPQDPPDTQLIFCGTHRELLTICRLKYDGPDLFSPHPPPAGSPQ